jgi:hypothetical protein
VVGSPTRPVALSKNFGQLSFETCYTSFELVDSVPEGGHLTLDELPRAVTDPLIHLRRGLLDRFTR